LKLPKGIGLANRHAIRESSSSFARHLIDATSHGVFEHLQTGVIQLLHQTESGGQ